MNPFSRSRTRWRLSKRAKWIFLPLLALAMLNFAAFVIGAIYLGGDAVNGFVRDGSYFLSEHGRSTEVSQAVWNYSYGHAISVWITHGLVFVSAVVFLATGDMAIEKN